MKGIILAGGHGTRLQPLTLAVSKQLLPVYDKPMIYYPLSVLIECGIQEIAVVVKSSDYHAFERLLGTGIQWGVEIEYYFQNYPKGVADAFLVCEKFIGNDSVCLILGDNVFTNPEPIVAAYRKFEYGASIIGYECSVPNQYGVMCFDDSGCLVAIEEKPRLPKSHYAVTGVYFYDNTVVAKAKELTPSPRGELEITDINNSYIVQGEMRHHLLSKPADRWMDAGTADDLHWASMMIRSLQDQGDCKIGCPYAAAARRDKAMGVAS